MGGFALDLLFEAKITKHVGTRRPHGNQRPTVIANEPGQIPDIKGIGDEDGIGAGLAYAALKFRQARGQVRGLTGTTVGGFGHGEQYIGGLWL